MAIALLPVLLASCQGDRLSVGRFVIGAPPAPQHLAIRGRFTTLVLQTEGVPSSVTARVRQARFVIGTRMLPARASEDPTVPNTYVWSTPTPCAALPQGHDLPGRYELLGADDQLLQRADLVLDIHTCE